MAEYQIDNAAYPIEWQGSNDVKRILQNAKNLLMCKMGEVPFERYAGLDQSVFDKPAELFKQMLIKELDRLMLWEPGVEVTGAESTLLSDGSTYIRVKVEVNTAGRLHLS